jgi:uncharacterized membrane protein SirB2
VTAWIKVVHVACAGLTLVSFGARGIWMLAGSPLLLRRATRIVPHVIDSVLFASGLVLAIAWHGGLRAGPWLPAKLAGVLLYIALGVVALRPGRPRPVRAAAFVAALCVFAWIVWVAHTRSIVWPMGLAELP